jgi:hypothetical protein
MRHTSSNFVRNAALAAAIAALPAGFAIAATEASAQAMHEITITIAHVKALDQFDLFSKGDFFAKMTVDGQTQQTAVIKQQAEIRPNWVLTQKVPAGKHDVKLELFDKDLTKSDSVDVNPLDSNRVLEAVIDTKRCRISGYGRSYRCGGTITIAGKERKAAAMTFKVAVKR